MRTVLVHAGICDASIWDAFELPGELVRHQLPAPLDETFAGEPAALVGNSFGGLLSLDLAARRPELATKLVLLDAALPGPWLLRRGRKYAQEEERLLEAGNVDAAVGAPPVDGAAAGHRQSSFPAF